MPKLTIHTEYNPQKIELERLIENLKLTPLERFEKAFSLMHLSMLFKKGPIKLPEGKGIVLKKKGV